jgi:putative ABC transport system permease protein
VASVIAMQSIGQGAKQEILEQIKLVGGNNIVILHKQPEKDDTELDEDEVNKKKNLSLGLNLGDGRVMRTIMPQISALSPEITRDVLSIYQSRSTKAKLIGVVPDHFEVLNLSLKRGSNFSEHHMRHGSPVCILGHGVARKFFGQDDPIGKMVKCHKGWYKVIGVLDERNVTTEAQTQFGIGNYNTEIYTPITTMLLRYENKQHITKSQLMQGFYYFEEGTEPKQYNQIDKLVIQVNDANDLLSAAEVAKKVLLRRHGNVEDFEVIIPQHLLQQQQRTRDIFNIVLGVIAGISLLVGGIGIMNIMLVSVMERRKEMGIRMALGATKKDIVLQFMSEAMLLSIMGGLAGILLGLILSESITEFTDIPTIESLPAILLAFTLSAGIGIIFGIAPAREAAASDPVESLRHE